MGDLRILRRRRRSCPDPRIYLLALWPMPPGSMGGMAQGPSPREGGPMTGQEAWEWFLQLIQRRIRELEEKLEEKK